VLHPDTTSAVPFDNASHVRWIRVERILAGLTILDGLLGLAVWMLAVWMLAGSASGALALLSLLALFAGINAWRGRPAGHLAALAFYGLQLATYHAFDSSFAYRVRGGLNLGAVVYLPNAVLVLNLFAIGMFAACAALLWWRVRGAGQARARTSKS